jgi:phosphoglycolate phosphatase/putative hydrolase of the HAD superfamily
MKLFLRPRLHRAGVLAFDLDGTLYHNPEYLKFQEESQIEQLADYLHIPNQAASSLVLQRKKLRKERQLPPTSLANIFKEIGVPDDLIIEWRKRKLRPHNWLAPDPLLYESLNALKKFYQLALITNNPRVIAEESLDALGVASLIATIIALDDTGKSKPDPAPFQFLLQSMSQSAENCIVIGDRYDIDIHPALNEGMSGILIDNVKEIYLLPKLLLP